MSLLARKAVRDLRAMGLRAVMIVLVVGAGAGTAAGISLALHDVRTTRDAFYASHRLADLDVRLQRPLPAGILEERGRAAGAGIAETRLIADGEALLPGGEDRAAEVVGMPPKARLNEVAVVEGGAPSQAEPGSALLEADFAERSGIGVGDRLRLRIGGRTLAVRVSGLARSPEYLLATTNPEYLLPRRGSLAVLFMPLDPLQRALGLTGKVNDLALSLPSGTPAARVRRAIRGLPVARLIPRERQYSLLFTNADIQSFSTFTPVMGGVFAIVAFLLVMLSLRRLVHSQRRELGGLLALGYGRGTVALTVLVPAALLAVGGGLLSIPVALGVARLVAGEYSHAVGFPTIETSLATAPLLGGAGTAVAATLVAAAAPTWRLTRMRPTEAMRGERPSSFVVPVWLERATASGGTALAYGIRTLLRRPLLTGATVLSIGAAIGLGAAMNVLLTSTNDAVAASFANEGWTHSVDLTRPLARGRAVSLARAAGARRVEPVASVPARLRSADGSPAYTDLVAVPAAPALERPTVTAGTAPTRGGVTITEQTAADLGVEVGDRIAVATGHGREKITVAGVARSLAGDRTYIRDADAAPLLGGRGEATGLLVAADPAAAELLRREPAVARVTSRAAAERDAHDLVTELTSLVNVLLAISLGVGALFLISSLTLSFLDRQGEFATLRALGNGRRQLAAIVGGEALAETLLAAVISIPLGLLIAWVLSDRIGAAWFRIGLVSDPPDFALAIGPAIALALLAAAFAVRRVLRLDIARAVRARLIG